jgi:hypothetical protein
MLHRNLYAFVTALLAILITLLLGSREVQYGGLRIEMRIEQIRPSGSTHFKMTSREKEAGRRLHDHPYMRSD